MKVTITSPAVTYIDGEATSLNVGDTHDLPAGKADALIAAGIARKARGRGSKEPDPAKEDDTPPADPASEAGSGEDSGDGDDTAEGAGGETKALTGAPENK